MPVPPHTVRLRSHRRQRPGADFDLPCGRSSIALLKALRPTGGTAPGEVVGRLLEAHQVGNAVSVAELAPTGRAFGFEWRDSLWIPMFEFDSNDLMPVKPDRVPGCAVMLADAGTVLRAAKRLGATQEP